jgi:hypothetical protein
MTHTDDWTRSVTHDSVCIASEAAGVFLDLTPSNQYQIRRMPLREIAHNFRRAPAAMHSGNFVPASACTLSIRSRATPFAQGIIHPAAWLFLECGDRVNQAKLGSLSGSELGHPANQREIVRIIIDSADQVTQRAVGIGLAGVGGSPHRTLCIM